MAAPKVETMVEKDGMWAVDLVADLADSRVSLWTRNETRE